MLIGGTLIFIGEVRTYKDSVLKYVTIYSHLNFNKSFQWSE